MIFFFKVLIIFTSLFYLNCYYFSRVPYAIETHPVITVDNQTTNITELIFYKLRLIELNISYKNTRDYPDYVTFTKYKPENDDDFKYIMREIYSTYKLDYIVELKKERNG